MYLKRLELQGFKSFPEKIKLEFNKGITSVVGPNGSGKSNISDAVRWVLGEQSAKSLRGAKMEDIIFAGTATRKPLGFAEVSIIIDNSDKTLALDYTDITITRRVYRSGDSGFFINNSPCRLKDIHEMFMDTGIGREGYSIIGQGQIEEILSAKSEDRRLLFEEATGIVKYKSRRHESLSKLERESQNLIRVCDIINELESKLEPLQIQSEKARTYLSLMEKLKLVKINIFLIESTKSSNLLKELKENILIIINQQQFELNKEKNIIAQHEQLKLVSIKNDESLKFLSDELIEIRSSIEQKENDIKLLNEKNNYIDSDIERLDNDELKKNDTIDNYQREKKSLEDKSNELLFLLEEKNGFLEKRQQSFDKLNTRISESQIQIDKYNTSIISDIQKTSDVKSHLQAQTLNYERLESRKEQIIIECSILNEQISTNESKEKELAKNISSLENSIIYLEKDIENLNSEKELLTLKRNDTKDENTKIIKLLNETESRHKVIKELEEDYEGYFKSIKSILKEKKRNKSKYEGIHGAVGELITVSALYETAIEIALGGYVQNIITETEQDAKIAIDYLKSSKEGRATFLPLTVIKPKYINNQSEIEKMPGVCGIAKDLILYDEIYENVMSNLLGRVVICDTLDNAISLGRKYNNTLKIVTLEGDLLNSGGAMTGGSISKKSTSIFSRTREIIELAEKIIELRKNSEKLSILTQSIEKEISIIKLTLDEKRTLFHQRDMEKASLNQIYIQTKDVLSTLVEKRNDFILEDTKLMEEISFTNNDIKKHSDLLIKLNEDTEQIKTDLSLFQSSLIEDGQSRESRINELTDIKVFISTLTQDLKSISQNINRLEKDIESSNKNSEKFKFDKEQKMLNKTQNNEIIHSLENIIANLNADKADKLSKIEILDKKKNDIIYKIKTMENQEREQLQLLSKIENEKTKLELKFQQVEEENRRLFDSMWEEYEVTYQQALKYEKLDDTINNLYKLELEYKNDLKNIGTVNVSAVDEYKEIKSRYEFLTVQKDDIINAEEKLKDIIFELTKLMEVQFKDQFKIISENFNTVYSEIFEGGKAYLQFSDDKNILESGIDIIAKPPGKSLQNMNLLSGGERSLTAIALLFAILKMKPSPFCILDEIESALDDANVRRYANYLKKFSDETQFILITHRKGTMLVSDILYGVTMQEQGVSKLVSVDMKEKNIEE